MAKIGTDPNIGKATRFPHNDPTKGGRKPSIRKQLVELMEQDGKITIPSKQIVTVNDDGSVTMILPTQMQLAMKLTSWAMSSKGGDSIKSIQMIMEQMDGKPKQEIDVNPTGESVPITAWINKNTTTNVSSNSKKGQEE